MQLFHLRHVWTVLVFMNIVYMTRILIKSKLLGEGSMDLRVVLSPVVEYITFLRTSYLGVCLVLTVFVS